jgi:hypothetical protein
LGAKIASCSTFTEEKEARALSQVKSSAPRVTRPPEQELGDGRRTGQLAARWFLFQGDKYLLLDAADASLCCRCYRPFDSSSQKLFAPFELPLWTVLDLLGPAFSV